jgi:class 3 adenylate cyclase
MVAEREQIVKLAQHLRRDPSAVNQSPEELSATLGIPVTVVASLMKQGANPNEGAIAGPRGRSTGVSLRAATKRFGERLDALEPYSLWVFLVSMVVGVFCLQVVGELERGEFTPFSLVCWVGLFAAVFTQLGSCFRWSKVRHAIKLGLLCLVCLLSVSAIFFVIDPPAPSSARVNPLFLFLVLAMVFVLVSTIYTGIASIACILGAMVRFRAEDVRSSNLSRQQLLDRVFQIEESLAQGGDIAPPKAGVPAWEWVRQHQIGVAIGSGFVFSAMVTALSTVVGTVPRAGTPIQSSAAASVMGLVMLVTVVSFLVQPILCFVGGSIGKSIRNALIYAVGSVSGNLAIVGLSAARVLQEVPRQFTPQGQWPDQFLAGLATSLFIGLISGMGAYVQSRSEQARRHQMNDPQLLMSELVDIQRRLSPTSGQITVMSIDAAKSSQMKANSDAFTAEWSFRAYQNLIQEIVESNGGSVHSTQGDGAICTFRRAEDAFLAARTLQTRIADFNQNVNRLRDHFRLRIGLHMDTIGGKLEDVQFSSSIDIAAHVEGEAPIGGISATLPVIEALPGERFAMISNPVDGFPVGIALSPVLDIEANA